MKLKLYFALSVALLLFSCVGIICIRFFGFPAWVNSSHSGVYVVFFLSTGEFIDPDHEFTYQPDNLEGVTLFGIADYLREENEPKWSYVSTGGLFYPIEEATPAGLRKLGWKDKTKRIQAAKLWTSEVIVPPLEIILEPDDVFLEKDLNSFYKPKFFLTEKGGVEAEFWVQREDTSNSRRRYSKERIVYNSDGFIIEWTHLD
ncbi:MAG: hypothetical protein AB8G95_00210 [Anaerolineae bacterium]